MPDPHWGKVASEATSSQTAVRSFLSVTRSRINERFLYVDCLLLVLRGMMKFRNIIETLALSLLMCLPACGQTQQQINLNTQVKGWLQPANGGFGSGYISGLPTASTSSGQIYVVHDALNSGSCATGGGSYTGFCQSNGIAWVWIGGSGGTGVQSPVTTPSPFIFGTDMEIGTRNPYVDIRLFGARAISRSSAPSGTITINSGSTSATLSSASSWVNGDGIVVLGAGPTPIMSTPTGSFTVTPSIAAGETGSGIVVYAPTGSTTYQYQIVGVDVYGGRTAASAALSTTTGSSSLGYQSLSITSCSRSTNVVTCTTAKRSPEVLYVGAGIQITGTSDKVDFDGWFTVNTLPNKTTFTYLTNVDVRGYSSGVGASETGGKVGWYSCNHLLITPPTSGGLPFFYLVYGRTSGSMNFLGATLPVNSALVGDPTYLSWDDFGSTMSVPPVLASFIPSTPQSSASNGNLITRIVGSAGTTSITLANPASNSASGATAIWDDGPPILAAANYAYKYGGMLYIPATAPGTAFSINSHTKLPLHLGISQAGSIVLNDTLDINGAQWWGNLTISAVSAQHPQFSQQGTTTVKVGTAYPGVYSSQQTTVHGLGFAGSNPNSMLFVSDTPGVIPSSTWEDCSFVTSSGQYDDYMGMGLRVRGQPGNQASGLYFVKDVFLAPPTTSSTATPVAYFEYGSNVTLKDLFLQNRGLLFQSVNFLKVDWVYRQAGVNPMFALYCSACGLSADFNDIVADTDAQPFVSLLGNSGMVELRIKDYNGASSGEPGISGYPFAAIIADNAGTSTNLGANTNLKNSAYTTVLTLPNYGRGPAVYDLQNRTLIFDGNPGFNMIWPISAPASVTATLVTYAGGGLGAGIDYFVTSTGYGGGESTPSAIAVCTGSSGNACQITWTAVQGAKCYNVYRSISGGGYTLIEGGQCTRSGVIDYLTYTAAAPAPTAPGSGIISIGYDSNGNASVITPKVQLPPTTVGNLPAASLYPFTFMTVYDSTAITTEGQRCVGGSSNKAVAFSNGSIWKCF